ncbi:Iron-sulfur cluster insertion protein ErpA [Candidatus Tremblaya princeps]|uniref:Iron-sulfur cluster insertion protein ErpA n=1 Tax=Tremblaya princeps TaxID=189385 RepID=A0A143WRP4_TREPR|nr:Iron-sulfur cluster insertion protein ErpA [Candidatus Tremblaya princeps]
MWRLGLTHGAVQRIGYSLGAGRLVCAQMAPGGCSGMLCRLATEGSVRRYDVLCISHGMVAAVRTNTAAPPPQLTVIVTRRSAGCLEVHANSSYGVCGCGRSFSA